jgi:hypothetical protein
LVQGGAVWAPGEARVVANLLTVAGAALGAWALLYPHPWPVIVAACVAAPGVAAVVINASGGAIGFDSPKGSRKPSVGFLAIFPTAGMALRVAFATHFVNWGDFLIPAALGAIVAGGAMVVATPAIQRRSVAVAGLGFLGAIWGVVAFMGVDTAADLQSPRNFTPTVLDQRISRGKSTSYYLTVSPWGPHTGNGEISVESKVYYGVGPGQTVCVTLHAGLLHAAWYRTTLQCPELSRPGL